MGKYITSMFKSSISHCLSKTVAVARITRVDEESCDTSFSDGSDDTDTWTIIPFRQTTTKSNLCRSRSRAMKLNLLGSGVPTTGADDTFTKVGH